MNNSSSFMDHFTELNKRFILLILSIGVAFVPGWILYDSIIEILLKPLNSIGYSQESLVVHQITEPLQVKISVVFPCPNFSFFKISIDKSLRILFPKGVFFMKLPPLFKSKSSRL